MVFFFLIQSGDLIYIKRRVKMNISIISSVSLPIIISSWLYFKCLNVFHQYFSRHKVNSHCLMNFPCSRCSEIIDIITYVWPNLFKAFFDWYAFIFITLSFVFNLFFCQQHHQSLLVYDKLWLCCCCLHFFSFFASKRLMIF